MSLGLRERKKLATRSALAAAALRLAAEHGAEHVTVEDIAAAADVSPRTFFNHFSSKEEAFVAEDLDRARELLAGIHREPLDQPAWSMVTRLLGEHLTEVTPDRGEARALHGVRTSPAVMAQQARQYAALEHDLITEIARRLPTGSTPLQARLVAATVVAAMRAAVTTWLEDEPDRTPRELFDDAVAQLSPAFR